MIRLELMMGLDIPDEGTVTPQMFDDFIRTEIGPRLDFATIIDGVGLWKGTREDCKILVIMAAESDQEMLESVLRSIGKAYAQAFRQDSVGLVCTPNVPMELIK